MTWIRWDTDTPYSDVIGYFAEKLGISLAEALGHYTAVMCGFGAHMASGNAELVPDNTLEQWAIWGHGKRGRNGARRPGAFAAVFRARCVDEKGYVKGWWRQEALVAKRERDRTRRKPARVPRETTALTIRYDNDSLSNSSSMSSRTAEPNGAAPKPMVSQLTSPPVCHLHDERHLAAYSGFLTAAKNPAAVAAEVLATATGMPGHGPGEGWDAVGQALHEMAAAGAPFTTQTLRAFVRKLPTKRAEGVVDNMGRTVQCNQRRMPDGSLWWVAVADGKPVAPVAGA